MIDSIALRRFVPISSLNPTDRAALAKHCRVVVYEPGESPFRRDTATANAAWLLSGEVELDGPQGLRRVSADSEQARYALANAAMFCDSARCLRRAEVLYVDREQLDRMLTWSQAGIVEVRDIEEDDSGDWMASMLRSPVLQRVPPSNIVRVISSVEQVEFAAGEPIIRIGAPGDYYYLLVEGEARVLRPPSAGAAFEEVDRLMPGDGFGEEALVSGAPRNATVEAVTRCRLARLAGREFDRFLREPLVQSVSMDALEDDVLPVDVRMPEEFAGGHLPGAVNIPLRTIRERCDELDRRRKAVVYCDGGGRSASATFLLTERGFDARWLEGWDPLESTCRHASLSIL